MSFESFENGLPYSAIRFLKRPPVQEIADTFGVSRPTIYRHLAEHVERA